MSTTRRHFVVAASGGLAGARWLGSAGVGRKESMMQRQTFRTPLCDVLGIDYPVLQAPMQSVVVPRLVAAVCEAGGLGILPGMGVPPDQLRRHIAEVRSLTRRPFGVNLILHSALRSPAERSGISPDVVRGVHGMLNRFRERLGLPPRAEPPPPLPDVLAEAFGVVVEERVPLFSTGLGLPTNDMVQTCHAAGMKVMCMVATLPDAREAESLGADVIAAQGAEAGGHRSVGAKPRTSEHAAIGTMVLVPQVAQAVRVPVVAAGGISNGRGLAAAVALGATGVLMGTRFIASVESAAPDFHKQALVAGSSDDTTLSDAFTGHYARFLRNDYIEEYRASAAPVFPPVTQQLATRDIVEGALKQQIPELYPLYAGQGIGLIDSVPSAREIVESVVQEARSALAAAAQTVRLGTPA